MTVYAFLIIRHFQTDYVHQSKLKRDLSEGWNSISSAATGVSMFVEFNLPTNCTETTLKEN